MRNNLTPLRVRIDDRVEILAVQALLRLPQHCGAAHHARGRTAELHLHDFFRAFSQAGLIQSFRQTAVEITVQRQDQHVARKFGTFEVEVPRASDTDRTDS